MGLKEKQQVRRRKVWELYVLGGYTQAEVAELVGVSRPTVIRDLRYLDKHPEELPVLDEEAFATYVQKELWRTLEEGKLKDYQKVRALVDLARSLVTRKVKKEEAISVKWGSDEGSHTDQQEDR